MDQFDVVVIGAGAAGMMCAIEAGKRGRRVVVIDHATAPGEKIRISGGGRCNFTNINAAPANFLSANPHFAISALRRYTAKDFVAWVEREGIAYHEKTLGQLFCDGSAKEIIAMLTRAMQAAGVTLRLKTTVEGVEQEAEGFSLAPGVKIEILRRACGQPPRCAIDDGLIAIVTDMDEVYPQLPHFALDDIAGLAVFLLEHAAR